VVVQARSRAVAVVLMHEGLKCRRAVRRYRSSGHTQLGQRDLDESLGLAVKAGACRAGCALATSEQNGSANFSAIRAQRPAPES